MVILRIAVRFLATVRASRRLLWNTSYTACISASECRQSIKVDFPTLPFETVVSLFFLPQDVVFFLLLLLYIVSVPGKSVTLPLHI